MGTFRFWAPVDDGTRVLDVSKIESLIGHQIPFAGPGGAQIPARIISLTVHTTDEHGDCIAGEAEVEGLEFPEDDFRLPS
jgi:hypothetical protein